MAKIAIIGAGSVEFTRNILTDLGSYPELHGTLQLALHDIDEERLAYAERAANQVVERLGAGYTVSAHADRREAFDGADYLINEIQVGGYRATVTDFEIPTRYGLRQTIADTIGIGGIMRGLRTIPVMIAMGDEMAELCPDGLLLNYTNPMAMVPWGIWAGSRWPAARTIGVCHSVRDTHASSRRLVGLPEDQVEFRTAGFNHQCFVYVFRDRASGDDLYPRLREIVDADPEGLGRRVRVEIYKRFGYFPTESSRALERVRAVVPAPPRSGRAVPLRDRRVHPAKRREPRGVGGAQGAAGRRRAEIEIEHNNELASQFVFALETGRADRAVRQRAQRRADRRAARRRLRRGAGDGCRRRGAAAADRADPAAVPGAQPHVPERRRADRAGRGRGVARPRLSGGARSIRTRPRRSPPSRSSVWLTI